MKDAGAVEFAICSEDREAGCGHLNDTPAFTAREGDSDSESGSGSDDDVSE